MLEKIINKIGKQKFILGFVFTFLIGSVGQNILAIKTITIGGVSIVSTGILLTWIVFLCSDLVTELKGKKYAFNMVLYGALINIVWNLFVLIALKLPGQSPFIQECMEVALGSTWRISIASIVAYLIGNWFNNVTMAQMKKRDGEKKYCLRAIISTIIGQTADDFLFLILAFAPIGLTPTMEKTLPDILIITLFSVFFETIIESLFVPLSNKIQKILKK